MSIIDAHIHYGDRDPELLGLLTHLDLKFLNVCVAHDAVGQWRSQADVYGRLASQLPDKFAWCTSFDLPGFDDPGYIDRVIAGLQDDFTAGAIACKVWKNFGMEIKHEAGDFVMVDDPLLDPIFEFLAGTGKPLLTHIGEPLACWLPLDKASPHYGYYRQNPQWHMAGRTDFPSHRQLIASRDRVLEKHPRLHMIGAHLGSLEYDVEEVANRLDRFPNFAVDISARLADLAVQDSTKVRRFFVEHQDRILFGTDVVMRERPSEMAPEDKAKAIGALQETYEMHFAYVEKKGSVMVRGRETEGLNLPAQILEKFYVANARNWYPGI